MSRPSEEVLFSLFYDLFRSVGVVPSPQQTDMLRKRSEGLSNFLQKMSEGNAMAFSTQLQEATRKGFLKADEKFRLMNDRVEEINNCISLLSGQLTEISQSYIGQLKALKKTLESQPTGSSQPEVSEPSQTQEELTELPEEEWEDFQDAT